MTPAIAGGRPGARAVKQARPEVEVAALKEAVRPVVNGLTTDLECLGDLLGSESLGEPEHRLGTTPLLGRGCPEDKVFQFPAQASIQADGSHRVTPLNRDVPMIDPTCQRTCCQARTHSFFGAPHGEPENRGENGGSSQ